MRVCACGCGASMEDKRESARYASDRCRAYASDVRRGIKRAAVRSAPLCAPLPPSTIAALSALAVTWGAILGFVSS